MSNQFKLCNKCVKRHCNKKPVAILGVRAMGDTGYKCTAFIKYKSGFTMEEVVHEPAEQRNSRGD